MELQIEVAAFLMEDSEFPCRFFLISPPGDAVAVHLIGFQIILKNEWEKQGIYFVVNPRVEQKDGRKSKYYCYDFTLRISQAEMERHSFVPILHSVAEDDCVILTFSSTDQTIVASKTSLCAQSGRFREMLNEK